LYLFEAASPEAVAEAAHGSGLALERIVEAYQDPVDRCAADDETKPQGRKSPRIREVSSGRTS
jgi:hypothetical protein